MRRLATIPGISYFVSLAENEHDLSSAVEIQGQTKTLEFFTTTKSENHVNIGYHCHLVVANGRNYERDGYVFTIKSGEVYAIPHKTRQHINLRNAGLTLKKDLERQVKAKLRRFRDEDLLPVSEKGFKLIS